MEKQAVTSSQNCADLNKQQRVPMESVCDSGMIMLCLCHCHSGVALSSSKERSPERLTGWRPLGAQHCNSYIGKTAGALTELLVLIPLNLTCAPQAHQR